MSTQLEKFGVANYLPTICLCAYCGEEIPKTQKFCSDCRTQKGRKAIFNENVLILNDRKKQEQPIPEGLKSWQ